MKSELFVHGKLAKTSYHIPKGSMCVVCRYFNSNCSELDFESMKVIEKGGDTSVVKCNEFERSELYKRSAYKS